MTKKVVYIVSFTFIVYAKSIFGQCVGSLHGHIYDRASKTSLSSVLVKVVNTGTFLQTDKYGEFEFTELCPADYQLLVCAATYDTIRIEASIKANRLHFHTDIYLSKSELLEEIEVNALKEAPISTQVLQTMSATDLADSRGKPLGEMLKSIAGVNALSTGAGIVKPMIQGLHSQRVLILNNGVRQEGQQWGEDHAPEIDPFAAEEISVVKGAAGVRYGSDALSGVVILKPRPMPTTSKFKGSAFTIGQSNGRMGNVALLAEKGFSKYWAWSLQSSAKTSGDFHSPTYNLSNTGIRELNFSGGLSYQKDSWAIDFCASRFASEIGILKAAHTGNVEDLALSMERSRPWYVARFTYQINNPRQAIVHSLGKVLIRKNIAHIGKLSIQYAIQNNARKEYDIRRAGRSAIPALSLLLQTHTLESTLEHHSWRDFVGSVGLSSLFQTNYNIPETGIVPLLPNFTNFTQGIFWIERFVKQKYEIELGMRYDYKHTQVRTFVRNTTYIKPTYQFHYVTATIGASYYPTTNLTLKTNIGTTYRPPHTVELFSQGLHLGIGNIQEGLLFKDGFLDPNANFSIEKSYKWVASAVWKYKNWYLDFTPYYSFIDNFIYLTPSDIRLTIRGTFPVFGYTQDNIMMRGIDIMSKYTYKNISWESKLAYLQAHIRETNAPLINMPPLRWDNRMTLEQKQWRKFENLRVFVNGLYVTRQNNAPRVVNANVFKNISDDEKATILQAGNFDFMEAPKGYFLLGAGISATYKKTTCTLRADNINNAIYRDYLNRWRYFANDIGRNFILQFNYNF